MSGLLRFPAPLWLTIACALAAAISRATPSDPPLERSQAADSLAALVDRLEPADLPAALALLDLGGIDVGDTDRDEGDGRWSAVMRQTATGIRWNLNRSGERGEVRLLGGGQQEPSGGAAGGSRGMRVHAGDLGLQAGFGLLLSGPGRWVGLTTAGDGRGGFQADLHPGAAERRTTRGFAAVMNVGAGRLAAWHGRAREAGEAPRAGAALTLAGGHGEGTCAVMAEGEGRGGTLIAAWTAGALALAGEASAWRAVTGGPQRAVWVASGRWRTGRRTAIDVQVAAAQPGPAPRSGQRPAALAADDGRGWLVRLRRRFDTLSLVAACGAAERQDWSAGAPRVTSLRRWSLEGDGGVAGRRWGASLTGRSEEQRGWRGRMPWLPSAVQSAQDVWRAAAWIETAAGAWRGRFGWRTLRTVGRDGATASVDDRSAVSLSVGATHPYGFGWRFVQAWAWGGAADLLSVEVPAPGLLSPRHWGRWRDERSFGVHWRRGGARISVGAACRRPQAADEPAVYELRAAAGLEWRGY